MAKQIKTQEKAISAIIKRHGATIDLKKSPFLLGEIIKEFGAAFQEPDPTEPKCPPTPGSHGAPPPPPPGTNSIPNIFDKFEEVAAQVKSMSDNIKKLHTKIDKLGK